MRLCEICTSETIFMHPNDDPHSTHYVELIIDGASPTFAVTCCCNDEWIWEFMYSKTNYDMVKHVIMDVMFDCDSMEELIEELDEVFETEFYDMTCECIEESREYKAEESEICDGECENCEMIFEEY